MRDHTTMIRKPAAALLALVLAALPLAACGSAAKKSTPATATTAARSPTPLPSASEANRRYEALLSCMARNGIHVAKSGTGTAAFGTPPAGVSVQRYERVLRKCGFGGRVVVPPQLGSQSIKAALQRYGECMRTQGFDIAPAGVAGATGSTKIDTQSPKFKAAAAKCGPLARAALGATPGAR